MLGGPNWQFHAIAVSVIVVMIMAIYAFLQPKEETIVQKSAYAVSIEQATYGENCNKLIEQRNKMLKAQSSSMKPEALITRGNASDIIASHCNGKEICSFTVSPTALGIDPYARCLKVLEVEYRCFSFDQLRVASAQDQNLIEMSCSGL